MVILFNSVKLDKDIKYKQIVIRDKSWKMSIPVVTIYGIKNNNDRTSDNILFFIVNKNK